jgi:molybdopterin synthase sulfur carrier subunit
MVLVEFAASIRRHIECPAQEIEPGTLGDVLQAAMAKVPGLSHFVLDDQSNIRKHVAVFINKDMHLPRQDLQRPLHAGDKVLVAQALTGG